MGERPAERRRRDSHGSPQDTVLPPPPRGQPGRSSFPQRASLSEEAVSALRAQVAAEELAVEQRRLQREARRREREKELTEPPDIRPVGRSRQFTGSL